MTKFVLTDVIDVCPSTEIIIMNHVCVANGLLGFGTAALRLYRREDDKRGESLPEIMKEERRHRMKRRLRRMCQTGTLLVRPADEYGMERWMDHGLLAPVGCKCV